MTKNVTFKQLGLEVLILSCIYSIFAYPLLQGAGDYVFMYPFNLRDGSIIPALVLSIVISLALFFTQVHFALPSLLQKKGLKRYLVFMVLLYLGLWGAEEGVRRLLMELYDLPENFQSLYGVTYDNVPMRRDLSMSKHLRNFAFILLSFGYRYLLDWKQSLVDQAQSQSMLAEKWKAELDTLKAQINPHFLFNSLNNIYAITERNGDKEASEAISRLSGLTRFVLYDTASAEIPLQKEIDFIKNYIQLQQLRFTDQEIIIKLQTQGELHTPVSPFMLIPFVENAFKYGVKIGEANIIKIGIGVQNGKLSAHIRNAVKQSVSNHNYSGIGIHNVKKRLALVYPNRHTLTIDNNGEHFDVQLQIDLAS